MGKGVLDNASTRRDFLKTIGLGSLALTTAGGLSSLSSGCSSSEELSWDMSADIVVVGSGAAASSAAITAREQGASVIMLEKAAVTGGTTIKSGGVSWVPNNFALRDQGITDDRQDCLRFMARAAYPQIYDADDSFRFGLPEHEYSLLAAYYDNGYKTFDYLMDIGACQFVQSATLTDYIDHAEENKLTHGRGVAPQGSGGGVGYGYDLITQLKEWIDSHDIQVLTGHRVVQIVLNDDSEVIGVMAETDKGTVAVKANKAVIFGSGGFTHNSELIVQFQPGPLYGGCAVVSNEGDFVYLSQAVGAQLSSMNMAWNAQVPLEPALNSPSTVNDIWQPAGDSMILVNKYGNRVVNEKRSYNDRTKVHFYWDPVNQEYVNQILMMVFDQRNLDLYAAAPGGYPMPTPGTQASYLVSGQTLTELGQNIRLYIDQIADGIGNWRLADSFETNLEETVSRFNGFAESGIDEDFQRGVFAYDVEWHQNVFSVPATDTQWPLNDKPNITMYPFTAEGPYYCILIAGGTLDTCGGPRTNHLAQVLDTQDNPIPGLYGAGNCIATPTHAYFGGGATIGPALTFGHIAGVNAVNEPEK